MSEQKRGTAPRYSDEEIRLLHNIAKSDRSTWSEKIQALVPTMPGRSYIRLYQKIHSEAQKFGNMPDPKKSAATKKGHKVKLAKKYEKVGSVKNVNNAPVLKSSKVHPMKSGNVKVSQKEIRFPYKNIRIENGEVVISI